MRAAIYARMSTDKQNEASPADQIVHCRRYAEAQGWTVVEALVDQDAGLSGASTHGHSRRRRAASGRRDRRRRVGLDRHLDRRSLQHDCSYRERGRPGRGREAERTEEESTITSTGGALMRAEEAV